MPGSTCSRRTRVRSACGPSARRRSRKRRSPYSRSGSRTDQSLCARRRRNTWLRGASGGPPAPKTRLSEAVASVRGVRGSVTSGHVDDIRALLAETAAIAADYLESLGERSVYPDVTPDQLRE